MWTILLIEDDALSCQALTDVLEYYGYCVVTARSGAIGIEIALAYQPDLIICNVMLPDMLGWDILQQVQALEAIAATPFIFLTGLDERRYMRKAMILGADDYIFKPVSHQDLHQSLEALFRKRKRLVKPYPNSIKRVTKKLQSFISNNLIKTNPRSLSGRDQAPPKRG